MKFSSKKLIIVLVGFIFLFSFNLAKAEVKISEFVSHPSSGNEWIELFSTDSQNLSGWSLTELANPGKDTQHENTPKDLTGLTIPAGSVLVIDISGLNDSGDVISLYNGAALVNRVSYGIIKDFVKNLDAPEIDKSGALISNVWQTNQEPTKGIINPTAQIIPTGNAGLALNDTSNQVNITEINNKVIEETKIKTKIIVNNNGFVGLPLYFQAQAFGYSDEILHFGKYFWNFGDGGSKEISLIENREFTHTYFYPGEYVVSLDYYSNNYTYTPDATSEIIIKIVPTEITITRVGDEKDFFVELKNNSIFSIDLSNYFLQSIDKRFILPHNTILRAGKTIIISPRISNFSFADKNSLKLMNPEREVIYDYNNSNFETSISKKTSVSNNFVKTIISENVNLNTNSDKMETFSNDLSASVVTSDAVDSKNSNEKFIFIIFAIFIIISSAGVYFVRRKGSVLSNEIDFEILDE